MSVYRCPDPAHGQDKVPLKANNDRVFECPAFHKYWRREEGGAVRLVNLVSQQAFPAEEMAAEGVSGRAALNFMVDVPRLIGGLDFNALSLSPAQWKVISRVDGSSNLEEVRLLAGLSPVEAERIVHELIDAGLIEVRRKGGR
ncbi:MAG: hypothetical protein ACREAA_20900 [Candidatus Polarisedimenticolia bacterium]